MPADTAPDAPHDGPSVAPQGGYRLAPQGGGRVVVGRSALVVAIDGPSGAGKSTVARGTARALRLRYLDTGATYRALTWLVLERGVDPDDPLLVEALAGTSVLTMSADPDDVAVVVDGHDVTAPIRGEAVTAAVSVVSAHPEVRQRMVAFQRRVIGAGGIVVEGRDIGTVVCPDAPVKIFLTATPSVRATRRAGDLQHSGAGDVPTVEADLARRDRLDSTRVVSPLVQASDAVPVDTTAMDADAVIRHVLDVVAQRTGIRADDADAATNAVRGSAAELDQIGGDRR